MLDTFDHKFPAQSNAGMRVAADPGRFTVDMHGATDRVRVGDQRLSAKDLADIIRSSPDWDGEKPIRLISCQTGRNDDGFAAQLARELGVDVLAPTKDAWIDADGNVFASSAHLDGKGQDFRPGWPPNGNWATFRPDGTSTTHDQPHPPGHTPSWGKDLPDRGPRDVWRRGEHEPANASMDPSRFQPPQPHSAPPPRTPNDILDVLGGQQHSDQPSPAERPRVEPATVLRQEVHATVDSPATSTSDSAPDRTPPAPESTVDFPRDPDYLGNPDFEATAADRQHMLDSPYGRAGLDEHVARLEEVLARRPEVAARLEGVPKEQLAALVGYALDQSAPVNDALRTGDSAALAERDGQIRMIADVLKNFDTFQGKVYREIYIAGDADRDAAADRYATGGIVTERGFTSSASDPKLRLNGNIRFIIESASGRDISGVAPRNESEVLFPPGTSFEITAKYQDAAGKWVIEMREVPTPRNADGSLVDPPNSTTAIQPIRPLSEELTSPDRAPEPAAAPEAPPAAPAPPPVSPDAPTPPQGLPRQTAPGGFPQPVPVPGQGQGPVRQPGGPVGPQGFPPAAPPRTPDRQQVGPQSFDQNRPPAGPGFDQNRQTAGGFDQRPAPGGFDPHRPMPAPGFDPNRSAPAPGGQGFDPNRPGPGAPGFDPNRQGTGGFDQGRPGPGQQGFDPRRPAPGPGFDQGRPPAGGFDPNRPGPQGFDQGPRRPAPNPGQQGFDPNRPTPGPGFDPNRPPRQAAPGWGDPQPNRAPGGFHQDRGAASRTLPNMPSPGRPPRLPAGFPQGGPAHPPTRPNAPEPLTPRDPGDGWGRQNHDSGFGPRPTDWTDPQQQRSRPVETEAEHRARMEDLQKRDNRGERLSVQDAVALDRYREAEDRRQEQRRQELLAERAGARQPQRPAPDPGMGRPLGQRIDLDTSNPRLALRDGDLDRMYRTPSGMSVFPDTAGAHRASAAMVRPHPHSFTVDLHGTPNGVLFGGDRAGPVDPHTLADVIRANPDWAANPRPIQLLACQTSPTFARQLAQALGQPVTFSRADVWVDTHGNVFSSSSEFDPGFRDRRRPGWPPNGEFRTVGPDGVERVHGPYSPTNPPQWDHLPNTREGSHWGHTIPQDAPLAFSRGAEDGPAVPGEQFTFTDGTTYETRFAENQLDASTGFPSRLDQILAEVGVDRAEFDRLRNTPIEDFVAGSPDTTAMMEIRERIQVAQGELLQRALTAEAATNLLTNSWVPGPRFENGQFGRHDQTSGFTARYADVAHLRTPAEVIEGLRLDYTDNNYIGRNGRPPYEFTDGAIATLRFPFDLDRVNGATDVDGAIPIAYGNHDKAQPFPMGGNENPANPRSNPAPFAGHGFTASEHNPVPEFELRPHSFDQAEIWLTDRDGNTTLLGAYDPDLDNGLDGDGRPYPTGGWRITDEGQAYADAQDRRKAEHEAAQKAAAAANQADGDDSGSAPGPSSSGSGHRSGGSESAWTEPVDQATLDLGADQPADAVPDSPQDDARTLDFAAGRDGADTPGTPVELHMDPAEEGLSPAERELRSRVPVDIEPFGGNDHANPAYAITFDDGSSAIYKPSEGTEDLRIGVPATELAEREVASSRVDELLGFGLVPTTTMVDGPHGPGSMQNFVEAGYGLPSDQYPLVQQERMAVLDYVVGNTDRHRGNYMTAPDGGLVAIDHGYAFPESPDPEYGIRSDFTSDLFGRALSDEVMAQVRAVEPEQLRATLYRMGLSEAGVEGAVGRLVEIQAHGRITGEEWAGRLKTAGLLTVRGSRQ
ncbi:hypothetical protein [Crossiella equi]|uniref:hypothetical protein n=1 Tax=Crossiella equi TaxID=130796 RepID=UPI001B80A07F|nr:hypothetical protein [Crossiella equi]